MSRTAQVERNTLETQISVELNLDGTGVTELDTGIPFLEHMLDQIARHGLIDLDIRATGDLHIDDHHTVEDTGIGIPADKLFQLFESFRQVDNSTSRQYGGSGLGLAISYSIIRKHQGTIEVSSVSGQGATFAVKLPIERKTDDD